MVKIEYLCDHPDYIDKSAYWLYNEFLKNIMSDLTYDNFRAFFKKCGKEELPIRLAAVLNGECVGTVSIVDNDLSIRNYTPWLGGLYVDVSYRNNGIGQELINNVKIIVKKMGYNEVYLVTTDAGQYYRKLGWQIVEKCEDEHGQMVEVFKYTLTYS